MHQGGCLLQDIWRDGFESTSKVDPMALRTNQNISCKRIRCDLWVIVAGLVSSVNRVNCKKYLFSETAKGFNSFSSICAIKQLFTNALLMESAKPPNTQTLSG